MAGFFSSGVYSRLSSTGYASMSALSDELTNDPLARGYAGMTDAQAADSLNAANRDLQLSSITGDVAFGVTDSAEFNALTDLKKQLWMSWCGRSDIDPFASANVAFVQWVFGGGSGTVSALNGLRTVTNGQSRAQELGLGTVYWHDVQEART